VSDFRGAVLVAILMAAVVALAIVFPNLGERSGSIVVAETSGAGVERDEIRDTVSEYLLEHPEVIVDALEAMQNRRQQADTARKRGALAASRDALLNNSRDPFIGNPGAGITLVEFFDYQYPYCKRMAQVLAAIADEDSDLRIVFKELPVFGEPSALAARAANNQGKYLEFHIALMELPGAPSESTIARLAERTGLNLECLRADMESEEITSMLAETNRLAQRIGVPGTPAFIVRNEFIPGAISPENLREFIARMCTDS
jgi:protein-disulfide isomerase